ncbi:MAG: hypothetical protein KBT27_04950 [Prevotellaceae bacterium]|nr:hypothetical protein [Candidatus Faecinaster equi]
MGGVFLIVCILQELAASIFNCPEAIWRLWFGRYMMLIWLGYDITVNGIGMNKWRWVTSIVSIFALIVFAYVKPNVEPLFFNTGWAVHRWICYPYAAYLLIWVFYKAFVKLNTCISRIVIVLGRASYEIFLTQMILTTFNYAAFFSIKNVYGVIVINAVVSWILCIFVGLCWNRLTYLRRKNTDD